MELTDLGTLGGMYSLAWAINAAGAIVGRSEIATHKTHACLWKDGKMTDLGTLGGKEARPSGSTRPGDRGTAKPPRAIGTPASGARWRGRRRGTGGSICCAGEARRVREAFDMERPHLNRCARRVVESERINAPWTRPHPETYERSHAPDLADRPPPPLPQRAAVRRVLRRRRACAAPTKDNATWVTAGASARRDDLPRDRPHEEPGEPGRQPVEGEQRARRERHGRDEPAARLHGHDR